jgi:photosystem II stability/assembly factor-like uncharacterized protein
VSWSQVVAPAGVLTISSVVCSAPSECTVIVNDGALVWSARSVDFGHTWQRMGNLPAGFAASGAMSCAADGPCLIGGYTAAGSGHGQGAIALSPDGGQTWTLASVPSGLGLLLDATCLTMSQCLAAGSTSTTVSDVVPAHGQLLRSADGGHTWTAVATPPVDAVYGIACPTARVCAMVGATWAGNPAIATGAVAQSGDGGTTFASSPSAYVPLPLSAVDCASAAHCIAAGGDTVARITLVKPAVHHAAHTSTTVGAAG